MKAMRGLSAGSRPVAIGVPRAPLSVRAESGASKAPQQRSRSSAAAAASSQATSSVTVVDATLTTSSTEEEQLVVLVDERRPLEGADTQLVLEEQGAQQDLPQATQQQQQRAPTPAPTTPHAPVFKMARLPNQQPPENERPLLPPIDPAELLNTMFFSPEPPMPDFLQGLLAMSDTPPTSPILYRPQVPRAPGSPDPTTLPLLLYLPGIDGTGLAAYRQFEGLSMQFDLCALFMPPADRSSFEQVVASAQAQLEAELVGGDPLRPVYLMGESFGGLVALALAQRCRAVDRVILCNPATSFTDSMWPLAGPLLTALPPPVYNSLPVLLSPVLTNPLNVALHALPRRPPGALPPSPVELASAAAWGLVGLLPELGSLRAVLPPPTLAHRLSLLREGAVAVNASLSKVQQRVLLLVGENDLVIPSATEGPRLKKALARCSVRVLRGRSHAMLQEAGLDLPALLREEGFYVRRRRLSSAPEGLLPGGNKRRARRHTPSSDPAAGPVGIPGVVPVGGASFGRALPVELPTPVEVKKAMDDGGLATLKALVSPVFFSTDPETGAAVQGLQHVPLGRPGRPVLLVGNHQLFAPDMPLMIAQFLQERGTLVRGLAHPFAVGGFQFGQQQDKPGGERATSPLGLPFGVGGDAEARKRKEDEEQGTQAFASFLKTFGAVPVNGSNLYSLLALGETALLYPGGVREAYKLKGEQYALIWPDKPEFVRACARLGATIVPFGAVGAEDGANIVLDSQELLRAPLLGDWLRSQPQFANAPAVRAGQADNFVPPLITFNAPRRFYYHFGNPIETTPELADDKAASEELYARVKAGCEQSIAYLLNRRDDDPYGDLVRRVLWERAWSGSKQAPTFEP